MIMTNGITSYLKVKHKTEQGLFIPLGNWQLNKP